MSSMIHELKQMYDKLSKWDDPEWKKLLESSSENDKKIRKVSAVSFFRQKYLSENKNANKSELFMACSKAWKELPDKTEYQKLADEANSNNKTSNKKQKSKTKKPLTGYNLFLHQILSETKKENPSHENSDLFKLVGMKWKELSDEEKEKYRLMASEQKSPKEEEASEQKSLKEEEEVHTEIESEVVVEEKVAVPPKKSLKRKPKD